MTPQATTLNVSSLRMIPPSNHWPAGCLSIRFADGTVLEAQAKVDDITPLELRLNAPEERMTLVYVAQRLMPTRQYRFKTRRDGWRSSRVIDRLRAALQHLEGTTDPKELGYLEILDVHRPFISADIDDESIIARL